MIIAQITDAHMTTPGRLLFGDYDPGRALRRTIDAVMALRPRPDVLLFTGDLTESGLPEEYAAVRDALAGCETPIAVVPGNHDRRAAFADAFAGTAIRAGSGAFLNLTLEDWPIRLIGLDTLSDEGASGGRLCEARLDWIAGRLAEQPRRPTVVFMHHPPFATGIGFMDAVGCENGGRFAEIVAAHGGVLRVLCGHVHRPIHVAFAGTVASVCPGIAYRTPLLLEDDAFRGMERQPPAFQLHILTEEGGLVTHTEYLQTEHMA